MCFPSISFFFFQAEDGIRDSSVTGVQTCALPIFIDERCRRGARSIWAAGIADAGDTVQCVVGEAGSVAIRVVFLHHVAVVGARAGGPRGTRSTVVEVLCSPAFGVVLGCETAQGVIV